MAAASGLPCVCWEFDSYCYCIRFPNQGHHCYPTSSLLTAHGLWSTHQIVAYTSLREWVVNAPLLQTNKCIQIDFGWVESVGLPPHTHTTCTRCVLMLSRCWPKKLRKCAPSGPIPYWTMGNSNMLNALLLGDLFLSCKFPSSSLLFWYHIIVVERGLLYPVWILCYYLFLGTKATPGCLFSFF